MDSFGGQETVKMLVFETDEPHPQTMKERGSFGEIIDRLFTEAGQNHDPPLSIETDMHFVVDDPVRHLAMFETGLNAPLTTIQVRGHHGHVPTPSEIPSSTTAILITGSMYDAHSDLPWIRKLRETLYSLWKTRSSLKFAGICFGHQILARTLGATVEPTPGKAWELAHTSLGLTAVGKKLFKTDSETLDVHQMHQDQVTSIPSSRTTDLLKAEQKVHVWASTDHTPIQGLYIRDRLFTSQGHLGFDGKMVRRQVELRLKSGAIEPGKHDEQVKYAEETAHLEHDGAVVAAAILRFFHGDDHDVD